jgi:hypothetical protein
MSGMILGIHSNVAGDAEEYTAGHAWLTITENGTTTFYGLWPDAHPLVIHHGMNNGNGSDIRIGLEAGAKPIASRYYKLSDAQAKQFKALMKANVGWRYTNTCASWASEVVYEIVGEDVDTDDYLGFETPRELGRNILRLERADPTSIYAPKMLERNPASSLATRASSGR